MHVLFHALLAFTSNKIPNFATRSRTPRFSTTPSMLAEGEWQITPAAEGDPLAVSTLRVAVAGKELSFETGGLARQASGSVTVKQGDTHVFCAACFEKKDSYEPIDFTPLRVDYFERKSSVGATAGGFIKRDGRPSDHETLNARIIDRPIRPLIADGWSLETQLTAYVLAYDRINMPEVMAVCAASASLALSEVPFPKPIACVRVGYVPVSLVNPAAEAEEAAEEEEDEDDFDDSLPMDGEEEEEAEEPEEERVFVVNPTREQLDASSLDLVIAGTAEAVLMIEGFCDFLPEETLLEAMELGLASIATICNAISDWASQCAAPTYEAGIRERLPGVDEKVADIVSERIESTLSGPTKDDRENWEGLVGEAVETLCSEDLPEGERYEKVDVKSAFKKLASETLRKMGAAGYRQDGRTTSEVRPIDIKMSPLPPQVHGSVLFTRGETQALATTTLGDDKMGQKYENLMGDQVKRFYLQYAFPPFSVGEVGRNGAPGRREIGHGNLAERAIKAAFPSEEEFPYVARVESLITESCGSSSMASVCGGCLALMAAGVPLKRMVAGVAMGLLLDESGAGGEPIVLTDILGSEDALGTMDFKVAGDGEGVTAFQLDIKCEGLSIPLMRTALEQAKVGRLHILNIMKEACDGPAASLPPSLPKMVTTRVEANKIGKVIGSGGSTIKSITEETGVTNIGIDDDGTVTVSSTSEEAIAAAIQRVHEIAGPPPGGAAAGGGINLAPPPPPPPPIEEGEAFLGVKVKSVVPFGIFCELYPGVDGFCHISELSDQFVRSIEDAQVAVGDILDVKVTQVNLDKMQYRVVPTTKIEVVSSGGGGGGGRGGGGRGGGRGRGGRGRGVAQTYG